MTLDDGLAMPAPLFFVDAGVAELIKYTTNAFLSTKVTFFNEVYEYCQAIGIDYDAFIDLVLLDRRIGRSHYKVPGPDGTLGFGGKCLPKDLCGFISAFADAGLEALLFWNVWNVNLYLRKSHEDRDWLNIDGAHSEE
jgi:UDPglucose 6-dehydrogenase